MHNTTVIQSRTSRLSILDGVDYISTSVGTFLSGPVYLYLGYYGVFGCSSATCLVALSYLIFRIKESLPTATQHEETPLENINEEHAKNRVLVPCPYECSIPPGPWASTSCHPYIVPYRSFSIGRLGPIPARNKTYHRWWVINQLVFVIIPRWLDGNA